jgi:hypothetical protein
MRTLLIAFTLLTGFARIASAGPLLIDTRDGSESYLAGLSSGGGAWGQTFTVSGSNLCLDSFSLFLTGFEPVSPGPVSSHVRGYIARFDSVLMAMTAPLYESEIQTIVPTGLQAFAFAPTLTLEAGVRYVAYLSTVGLTQPDGPSMTWGEKRTGGDVLAGESAVHLINGTWQAPFDTTGADAWFTASLSSPTSVPEPASGLLLLTGIGVLIRHRQQLRRAKP